jgi:hypothetical protein
VAGIAGEVSKKGAEVATSAKPFLDQLGPAAARAGKALAPVGDSLGKLGERTLVPAAKQTLGQGEAAVSGALKSLETSLSAQVGSLPHRLSPCLPTVSPTDCLTVLQVGFDVPLEKTVSAVAKEAPGVVKATVGVAQSVVQVGHPLVGPRVGGTAAARKEMARERPVGSPGRRKGPCLKSSSRSSMRRPRRRRSTPLTQEEVVQRTL